VAPGRTLTGAGDGLNAYVQFTINLIVVGRASWDAMRQERPHLPERPSAGVLFGGAVAQTRIGVLTTEGEDKWWRIYDGVDQKAVAADVIHDVRAFALPWLRARIDEQR
jgi:dihydrofolate reductase